MRSKFLWLFAFTAFFSPSFGQGAGSNDLDLQVGADLVSSYVWRGFQQGTGPAIQPWAEFSVSNLVVGAWGSYELSGAFKEVDIYAKYTVNDFTLQFVDLFFPDAPGFDQNFYHFFNKTTGHAGELGLSYNGSEKLPLSLYGGIILYGATCDPKPNNPAATNLSSYFEINYSGQLNTTSFNAFAGFTPSKSVLYDTNGFSFINVGVSASKNLQLTERLSLPLKLTLSTNPDSKKVFLTAVVSL